MSHGRASVSALAVCVSPAGRSVAVAVAVAVWPFLLTATRPIMDRRGENVAAPFLLLFLHFI